MQKSPVELALVVFHTHGPYSGRCSVLFFVCQAEYPCVHGSWDLFKVSQIGF